MGDFRACAATNKPGTCLWCGSKLRINRGGRMERTDEHRPPSRCEGCKSNPYGEAPKRKPSEWDRLDKSGDLVWFCCKVCGDESVGIRKTKLVKGDGDGKAGSYRDGFFCGLRCGYQFAVAVAGFGRRVEAKSNV